MKVYSTYEMLKEIIRNPDKKFQHLNHSDFVTMKWGTLVWSTDDESEGKVKPWKVVITEEFLSMKWIEKEKDVPWQEAIRAWCEDEKSFRIEMGGKVVFEQSSIFRMGLSESSKIPKLGIAKDWFKEGKWYIED